MNLRPHQIEKSNELLNVLTKLGCAYLKGEVRSGKTLTVLETANLYGAKKVLFVTKKKAIGSIQKDYDNFNYQYPMTIINYESVHKIKFNDYDLIIYDESHVNSGFPKPSKRTKLLRERYYNVPCIMLSGTPAAESYSQFFHQFHVTTFSPFNQYKNFYQWSKIFVNVTEKRIGTHTVRDYTKAKESDIEKIIAPYCVTMTQADAGIETIITEHILKVETPKQIQETVKRLIKDRAIEGDNGYIMAETPAKLQSKVHQIYNGSVIYETNEGESRTHIFSTYKADFIKERFKGRKIAIMYYYQGELEILKKVFKDGITTDLNDFNNSNKNFAIQQSSTEGMNISAAHCLVYYNFHFSGKNYIQSRDRLTIKERLKNDVYFIIETPGINERILNRVRDKKDFNISCFRSEFLNNETANKAYKILER